MSINDQIIAADRELAMRKSVYAKRVAAGKMSEHKATHETEAMAAILRTLRSVKALEESGFRMPHAVD